MIFFSYYLNLTNIKLIKNASAQSPNSFFQTITEGFNYFSHYRIYHPRYNSLTINENPGLNNSIKPFPVTTCQNYPCNIIDHLINSVITYFVYLSENLCVPLRLDFFHHKGTLSSHKGTQRKISKFICIFPINNIFTPDFRNIHSNPPFYWKIIIHPVTDIID